MQNEPENEANFERKMRTFNAKSGFLETSPNSLVRFLAKQPGRARFLASLGMTPPGKYENSGNEAKKHLKTKHLTLFSGVDYARFAHQLAQI